uniref:EamA domain-containing protein n=1 Tax=Aplanochytrium stocchinoi TaxID=215587 RepID=A0A7S3PM53_9STRA
MYLNFLLGVLLCILSATITSFGMILMKVGLFSALKKQELFRETFARSPREEREPHRRCINFCSFYSIYLGGLMVFIFGQALNLVSLSLLQQVVWAVCSLFSLVANAMFSSLFLGERITRNDLVCTCMIIFGSAFVVFSSNPHPSKNLSAYIKDPIAGSPSSSEDIPEVVIRLRVLFTRPWFFGYISVLLAILAYCFWKLLILPSLSRAKIRRGISVSSVQRVDVSDKSLNNSMENSQNGINGGGVQVVEVTQCSDPFRTNQDDNNTVPDLELTSVSKLFIRHPSSYDSVTPPADHDQIIAWILFSSTSASLSVLFGKCTSEIVRAALVSNHENELIIVRVFKFLASSPTSISILLCFIAAAFSSLIGMNIALRDGEALVVVPLLTCANTILTILGGIFYFEEFSSFTTWWRACLFVVGVLISTGGAIQLDRGRPKIDCEAEDEPLLTSNVSEASGLLSLSSNENGNATQYGLASK